MAGQLRVDEITDEAGTGSPSFPFGLPVGYAAGGTAPAASSFTEVPSNVLEVGDPIRSVDILAIKENTNYLKQFNDFAILDTQIFTASGTWTKPGGFDATDTVVSLVIGGGGSGGARRVSTTGASSRGGGGGGGVAIFTKAFGDIASAVSVTVGAGGASVTSTTTTADGNVNGNRGGDSIFDGDRARGGEGGDTRLNGTGGTGGTSQKFFGNSTGFEGLTNSGGNGRDPVASTGVTLIPYGLTGGGGAAASSGTTLLNQNIEAMTGALFGDGGNGSTNAVGAAGVAPGGGGGGCIRQLANATSGAGARGEVQVYVVRGRVTGEQLLGVSL